MDQAPDDIYTNFGASPIKDKGSGSAAGLWAAGGAAGPVALDAAAPPDGDALDVYGDLFNAGGEGETLLKTQLTQARSQLVEQAEQIRQLEGSVAELREEAAAAGQQRDALATNISSLYNTAKLEIQRKDAEIRDLRARLAVADAGGGAGPARGRPPAEQQQQQQQQQQQPYPQQARGQSRDAEQRGRSGERGPGGRSRSGSGERRRAGGASREPGRDDRARDARRH